MAGSGQKPDSKAQQSVCTCSSHSRLSRLAHQQVLACLLHRNWAAHAGHDVPFVNNYGVWKDEFRELGLESTLDVCWDDAMCYFGEDKEIRVGRGYGRCAGVRLCHV